MADDLGSAVGGALGSLLGSGAALASTQAGISDVSHITDYGASQVAPYNFAGANYLGPVGSDLLGGTQASANIGDARVNSGGSGVPGVSLPDYGFVPGSHQVAGVNLPNYSFDTVTSADPVNFQNFASNYNASEGAKYLQKTAAAAQDNTAAAKGGLLSGANLRAQTGIAEGIANQDLLQQYGATAAGQQQGWAQNQQSQNQNFQQQYTATNQQLADQQQNFQQQYTATNQQLADQQQNFQQEETSYQNLYGQEAMGLQAGTAEAGTYAQGARAIGSLYGTQATNAQSSSSSFGSALGSVFGALGKVFGL